MVYMPAQSFFFLLFSKMVARPKPSRAPHILEYATISERRVTSQTVLIVLGTLKNVFPWLYHLAWKNMRMSCSSIEQLVRKFQRPLQLCFSSFEMESLHAPGISDCQAEGERSVTTAENLEKGWSNLPDLPRTEMAGRSWQCGMAACGVTSSCLLAGLCRRWRLALVRFRNFAIHALLRSPFGQWNASTDKGWHVSEARTDTQLTGSRVPCQLRMATCFMRSGQGRPSRTTGPTRQFDPECEVVKLAVFLPLAYWGGDLLAATSTSSRGTW